MPKNAQTIAQLHSSHTVSGEGNGNPLQYSCLENPVDRGAWWAAVYGFHRVGQDWSNIPCMHALEKEMATHSSVLAWRIPGTKESGGLLSMGSHRVGHNWTNLAAAAAAHTSKVMLKILQARLQQYLNCEELMLKPKLQYFIHLMWILTHWKRPWCWERLKVGRIMELQRMVWLDGINDSMDTSLSKFWELVMDRESWRAIVHGVVVGHDWTTELNWTEWYYWIYLLHNSV